MIKNKIMPEMAHTKKSTMKKMKNANQRIRKTLINNRRIKDAKNISIKMQKIKLKLNYKYL